MNLILPLLAMAAAVAEPALKTPETSSLFEKFTDPASGVVSYLLKPGVEAYEQQSLYFTQKSMTDDGRFLVFDAYDGTNEVDDAKARANMRYCVVDFQTDRIIPLTKAGDGRHQIPFLDVKNDALYYVDRTNETFCRRDLAVDPLKEIRMCPMPKEILDIGRVRGWFTHLTMNAARTKAFIECRVTVKGTEDPKTGKGKSRFFQGTLDVTDGSWHPWTETDFSANHAAYHPFDENMAYYGWGNFLAGYSDRRKQAKKKDEPFDEKFLSMFLVKSDGTQWRFGPEAIQHATHQTWSEDGTYLYWCSRNMSKGLYGVYALDLKTRTQRCVAPIRAMHATISPDNRYIAFDWPHEPQGRGSGWETGFYDIETKRQVYIHSSRPPIADIPHKRFSNLHPDPHPQFVMNGRYIVSTFNTDTPRRMTVSVTPVAQLVNSAIDPAYPVCNAAVCPERTNDLVWENDKFGMRAYGPGEYHRWSGFDVFNKNTASNVCIRWTRDVRLNRSGVSPNFHQNRGEGMDNYTMGAARGVGGIAMFADGEWKTYPDWESSRVMHVGPDYCEFELVYPAFSAAGRMTCHITLRRGERFFRNDVSFERMPGNFAVGPGLDLEPKRDHHGDLVDEAGVVSLFEDPKGQGGVDGSTMSAIFVAPGETVEMLTDHQNCRVLGFRGRKSFTYWAGASWSLAGEITTAADWHDCVRSYRKRLASLPR